MAIHTHKNSTIYDGNFIGDLGQIYCYSLQLKTVFMCADYYGFLSIFPVQLAATKIAVKTNGQTGQQQE